MSRDLDKALTFLTVANVIAGLGTCDRKQVGAVIVKDGRCVSWGYNGAPPGAPHCSENNHGHPHAGPLLRQADEAIRQATGNTGCANATHAEANAIAFAARQGISTDGAQLFVTVSPCPTCARLIIAAGITDVHYIEEYRDISGVAILLDNGHVHTHHYGEFDTGEFDTDVRGADMGWATGAEPAALAADLDAANERVKAAEEHSLRYAAAADAAIRERDEARGERDLLLAEIEGQIGRKKDAEARVAELETALREIRPLVDPDLEPFDSDPRKQILAMRDRASDAWVIAARALAAAHADTEGGAA